MTEFDKYSVKYDDHFSHSKIGKRQRLRVWHYMKKHHSSTKKILELNGGTGEDARFLLKQGHSVYYSDGSTEMLKIAKQKNEDQTQIEYTIIDLKKLDDVELNNRFDIIFSNFGGLNCISQNQLQQIQSFAERHLSENGRLILVIMPQNTILDKWYRVLKRRRTITRSPSIPTSVNIETEQINTYYFNYEVIEAAFLNFNVMRKKIIGYFPSYLEQGLLKSNILWYMLSPIESFFSFFDSLVNYADHYLIELKLKA